MIGMNRIYLHISLWVIYFGITILFKSNNLNIEYAIKHSLVAVPILILLYYSYGNLAVVKFLETKKYFLFALFSIFFFAVFFNIKKYIEVPYFQEYFDLLPSKSNEKEERVVGATVLIHMLLTTIFFTLENRIKKEKKAQTLLNKNNEAQLLYLKAQINPHFLFNALNNIYSLSVVKSDHTPKMILNLADLLRYTIYEGRKEKVLIADEIVQIQKYFTLFQMTKEEPVNVKIDVTGKVMTHYIEPMILIPLVENCVKHGDFDINSESFAQISIEVIEGGLRFMTINSMNKVDKQKDNIGGVGLENIKKRLQLKYPNSHTFNVKEEGNVFEVLLNITKLDV